MPFRKPQGYARRFDLHKEQGHDHKDIAFGEQIMAPSVERDTFTCGHCSRIVHVHPKDRPEDIGGLCKVCFSLICSPCVELLIKEGCMPFIKKIEAIEHQERMKLSYDGK